ncbi:hypothetical protein [Streptomyces chrestomyceticus]|uniref:Uncharacterized protein n=1 Tax=Streptomyces chrestomyceticus TaxID=68185 RepID=A0ABU7X2C6_9ACTN
MIWIISKRRHTARLQAAQGRLARVKSQRDDAELTADALADDAVQRTDRIEQQASRIKELERALAAARRAAQQLNTDLDRAAIEVRELRRIRVLLEGALGHYIDAAEQPVHILVRDSRLHSIHRSKKAAGQAVRQADPSVPDLMTWTSRPGADPATGWWHAAPALPPLPLPPQAAAIEAYYRALETRRPAALPPASAGGHGSDGPGQRVAARDVEAADAAALARSLPTA